MGKNKDDKIFIASDEQQVASAEKQAMLDRDQELEDIRNILSTKSGIRFFKRFAESGGLFSSSFTGNSGTYYNEGRRSIFLEFFGDIVEAAPEKVVKIIMKGSE